MAGGANAAGVDGACCGRVLADDVDDGAALGVGAATFGDDDFTSLPTDDNADGFGAAAFGLGAAALAVVVVVVDDDDFGVDDAAAALVFVFD